MLFKKTKLKGNVSYEVKSKSKIEELTKKYQPVLIDFIKNNDIKNEKLFLEAFQSINSYIIKALKYKTEAILPINPLEKKLVTLASIYKQLNGSIDEEIRETVMESMIIALGYGDNPEKVFNPKNENSFIIKYILNLSVFSLINKLNTYSNQIQNSQPSSKDYEDHHLFSLIKDLVPEEILQTAYEFLEDEDYLPEDLKKHINNYL